MKLQGLKELMFYLLRLILRSSCVYLVVFPRRYQEAMYDEYAPGGIGKLYQALHSPRFVVLSSLFLRELGN